MGLIQDISQGAAWNSSYLDQKVPNHLESGGTTRHFKNAFKYRIFPVLPSWEIK